MVPRAFFSVASSQLCSCHKKTSVNEECPPPPLPVDTYRVWLTPPKEPSQYYPKQYVGIVSESNQPNGIGYFVYSNDVVLLALFDRGSCLLPLLVIGDKDKDKYITPSSFDPSCKFVRVLPFNRYIEDIQMWYSGSLDSKGRPHGIGICVTEDKQSTEIGFWWHGNYRHACKFRKQKKN